MAGQSISCSTLLSHGTARDGRAVNLMQHTTEPWTARDGRAVNLLQHTTEPWTARDGRAVNLMQHTTEPWDSKRWQGSQSHAAHY